MRTVLAALLLMLATPAMAECFHDADDPTWTLTKTERGFIWKQGDKTEELEETSVGTGISARVLVDADLNGYRFMYLDGKLILDMEVYEPGCE